MKKKQFLFIIITQDPQIEIIKIWSHLRLDIIQCLIDIDKC